MGLYYYKAKDLRGRIRAGSMQGSSRSLVKTHLQRMRLKPIYIKAAALNDFSGFDDQDDGFIYRDASGKLQFNLFGPKRATSRDLIVFTKQFGVMIKSGVPLVQALDVLAKQQRVRNFGKTLSRVRAAVENGATLSETLADFPKYFDRLYVAMVRAGEIGGNLDDILLELVTYIEKADKIKRQVKSAMMYPIFVMVVCVGVVTLLLTFVVPILAKQFQDSDRELPGLTQVVINISEFFRDRWYVLAGGALLLSVLFILWKNTPTGRKQFDKILLIIPGIGNLIQKVSVGRFCSTLASMLRGGVNLLEGLDICAGSSGNEIVKEFVHGVRVGVEQGMTLSEPLSEGNLFPPMVISMVAVGESTGALDEMLMKISEFYEDEVDLAVKTLISMVEPFLIVVVGGIVGFIVIAMYLPIFDLGNIVGG